MGELLPTTGTCVLAVTIKDQTELLDFEIVKGNKARTLDLKTYPALGLIQRVHVGEDVRDTLSRTFDKTVIETGVESDIVHVRRIKKELSSLRQEVERIC